MFGLFSSKKKKKRDSCLELIGAFTSLLLLQIEMEEIDNESFTADSKEALVYGLMLTGAIDAICQAADQDDLTWALGIKFAVSELKFPELFAIFMIQLHQKLSPNDSEFQIIIDGGKMAQQWMSDKLNISSIAFELSTYVEPFINNESISNSIGEIAVKYKLIEL